MDKKSLRDTPLVACFFCFLNIWDFREFRFQLVNKFFLPLIRHHYYKIAFVLKAAFCGDLSHRSACTEKPLLGALYAKLIPIGERRCSEGACPLTPKIGFAHVAKRSEGGVGYF